VAGCGDPQPGNITGYNKRSTGVPSRGWRSARPSADWLRSRRGASFAGQLTHEIGVIRQIPNFVSINSGGDRPVRPGNSEVRPAPQIPAPAVVDFMRSPGVARRALDIAMTRRRRWRGSRMSRVELVTGSEQTSTSW